MLRGHFRLPFVDAVMFAHNRPARKTLTARMHIVTHRGEHRTGAKPLSTTALLCVGAKLAGAKF